VCLWCESRGGYRRFLVTAVRVVIAPTLCHPTTFCWLEPADIKETYRLPADEETDLSIGLCRGGSTTWTLERPTRNELLKSLPGLGQASSVFAAEMNYRMPSIEAEVQHLGLSKLLKHGTPRLVYLRHG
jgi:hypothetical protein